MIIEGEQLVSLEIKSSNVIQLSFVAILLRANSITRGWCGDVGDIIMFPCCSICGVGNIIIWSDALSLCHMIIGLNLQLTQTQKQIKTNHYFFKQTREEISNHAISESNK